MSDKGKTISNFPDYSVTKDGRVWSKRRQNTRGYWHGGKWLKPASSKNGYWFVSLCRDNKKYSRSVHRLVLEEYVGPRPEGMEARHLNGNRADNYLNNLKWGTKSENAYDAVNHGTAAGFQNRGEGNAWSKLTDQKARLIYNLYHSGADTQQGLATVFGVCQYVIHRIVTRKGWRHIWVTT